MYDVSNACGYASDIKEGALNDAVDSKRQERFAYALDERLLWRATLPLYYLRLVGCCPAPQVTASVCGGAPQCALWDRRKRCCK